MSQETRRPMSGMRLPAAVPVLTDAAALLSGAASDLIAYATLLEEEGDGGERAYARLVLRPRAKALQAAARGELKR
jgi:hypothetical protein